MHVFPVRWKPRPHNRAPANHLKISNKRYRKNLKLKGNAGLSTFDLAILRSMLSRCEYAIRNKVSFRVRIHSEILLMVIFNTRRVDLPKDLSG